MYDIISRFDRLLTLLFFNIVYFLIKYFRVRKMFIPCPLYMNPFDKEFLFSIPGIIMYTTIIFYFLFFSGVVLNILRARTPHLGEIWCWDRMSSHDCIMRMVLSIFVGSMYQVVIIMRLEQLMVLWNLLNVPFKDGTRRYYQQNF